MLLWFETMHFKAFSYLMAALFEILQVLGENTLCNVVRYFSRNADSWYNLGSSSRCYNISPFRITCIFYVKEMANHLIKTCCLCSLTIFIQQSNEPWYLSGLANNTPCIFLNREIPKQVPLKKRITHLNLSLEEIISAKVFVR